MASATRLLNYPLNMLGKHFYYKLIGLSINAAVGVRNFHFVGCVKGLKCNDYFLTCGFITKFPLIYQTCAKSVANREEENTLMERIDSSQYPKVQLEKILSFLTNNGFSVDDGVEMVEKCPDILRRTEKGMNEITSSLRSCRLRDEEMKELLKTCPQILCSDPNAIVSRYRTLRQYFSHQHILRMLSRYPNIMLMKWKSIQQKILYLKNVMFVSDKQIALSSALEIPIEEIRARHMFLVRAGLFVIPDPKSNLPSNNPKLSNILDTDDVYFAENVAKLTAEEYFVFLEMFASECDAQERDSDYESEDSE